jgi:carbohydrate-selective porin OprB
MLPIGLGGTLGLGLPLAFLVKFQGEEIQGFVGAYDPNNCAPASCLNPLLADGPAYAAFWKFYTGIGPGRDRAGYVSFGGTYSTKQYTVIDPQSVAVIPGQGLEVTDTDTSWSIFSVVNQQLWADPHNPDRDINFRGLYTVTDGKANPISWSATAALEMKGLIPRRDNDVLGIGYFYTGLNSDFKETVGTLLSDAATLAAGSPARITIKDTEGFEVYYKTQVTPWFAITGDVQVITETVSTEDTKVVAGVRAKTTF